MSKFEVIITILCCFGVAHAQNVALSGVVKQGDGTPVEGAAVRLSVLDSLTVLTGADGTFSLKNNVNRVKYVPSSPLNRQFTLQGNSIYFNSTDLNTNVVVRVFAGNGKIITSGTIRASSAGNRRVTLPHLGSGVNYLSIYTGEVETVRPILKVGEKLYCKTGTIAVQRKGTTPVVKKMAAGSVVDTLIAEKNGYATAEYPLTSYEQDGIEIILEPQTGYADVTAVGVTGGENNYTFDVTLETSDIDCSHFANWFEVLTVSGELLYRRILAHPHTGAFSGNPFTRGGGPVSITSEQVVIVRAHLNDLGYVGMAMRGSAGSGFEKAPDITSTFVSDVASEGPQPEECIPEATIFGQ